MLPPSLRGGLWAHCLKAGKAAMESSRRHGFVSTAHLTRESCRVQLYWMVTEACAPLTVMACNPGSRAPPRVMVRGVWPVALV